jgi:anti-sigma regulatory factor (Ser/Thr protein kinase)
MTDKNPTGSATVRLDLPADTSYAQLVRAALAALAAQHDFSLDRIEDLRLAGTEAFAVAAVRAQEGAKVHVVITANHDTVEVAATVLADESKASKGGPGSLGWTLLTSLVDQLAETTDGAETGIWLRVRSDQQAPVPPGAAQSHGQAQ